MDTYITVWILHYTVCNGHGSVHCNLPVVVCVNNGDVFVRVIGDDLSSDHGRLLTGVNPVQSRVVTIIYSN